MTGSPAPGNARKSARRVEFPLNFPQNRYIPGHYGQEKLD